MIQELNNSKINTKVNSWLNYKHKIDTVQSIHKDSTLAQDWKWMQEQVFSYLSFHKNKTVSYVCELFMRKWLSRVPCKESEDQRDSRLSYFVRHSHDSPLVIKIFD